MEIEMIVELLIPDTTALTAYHTLQKTGFKQLKRLKREDYYRFSVETHDFERMSEELGKIDILVNANKNRFKTKLAEQPFEGKWENNLNIVRVLVQDIDNKDGGLLKTLQDRLGFKNIKSMERGVLWVLYLETVSQEESNKTAVEIAEKLLVNKHYQEYRILEGEKIKQTTYKDSGVDIDAANEAKREIKEHVRKTFDPSVELDMGAFAGAVNVEKLKDYKNPVLISSIDGVGTKLMVAAKMNKWDTVGKDMVGHSVDDILAVGAKPFFFLDYIASSKLKPEIVEQIVKGMSEACSENNIPLIAGETAEMPGVYKEGEHDVVGCIVGIVERESVVDGSGIKEGDVLIGLKSDGLHTNGFSLARKVLFDIAGYSVNDYVEELGATIGEELLKPHKSYVKAVLELLKQFEIRGIAHITGGGLPENIKRILPEDLGAEIQKSELDTPPIFRLIQEKGNVPEEDMFRTFNMGIGMVLIVSKDSGEAVLKRLESLYQKSSIIGRVLKGNFGVKII